MTENEGVAAVLSSSGDSNSRNSLRRVAVVDAPGHPRLRALAASRAPAATALVFVVDSSDFLPRKADAAEALAGLLAGSWRRRKKGIAVLLACNKSDKGEAAHSPEFIRRRLEKEIDALDRLCRDGRARGRGEEGAREGEGRRGESSPPCSGAPGEQFTFAGLARRGDPRWRLALAPRLKGRSAALRASWRSTGERKGEKKKRTFVLIGRKVFFF